MRTAVAAVLTALLLAPPPARADDVPTARTVTVLPPHPDDAPSRGPRDAPVVAEVFCNFAHVQCATAERMLRRMLERHPDELRVVYRQVVLPFRDSQVTAETAIEAFAQHRFLELADAAVARGTQVRGRDVETLAARAGMDIAALRVALTDHRHLPRLEEDALRCELLGAGSPGIVWNGVPSGDLSLEGMEKLFGRAHELAARRLADGVPRAELHASLVRVAIGQRARARAENARRRGDAEPTRVHVSAGNAPARGPKGAPVTIVSFSDYECLYCRRQEESLRRLLALYPDRVRVVYKQFPLGHHAGAHAAAEAVACARAQGKFFDLHDSLVAAPVRLRAADLERLAQTVNLDLPRWKADLAGGACAATVDADLAEGKALGVETTPTLFVNGVKIVGLRAFAELRALVEDESAPGILSEILSP